MNTQISRDAPSHANPSSEELRRLLERVEAASDADRELDAEIAVAFSGDPGAWVVNPSPSSIFGPVPGWYRTSKDRSVLAPPYTASLDAALALVERVMTPALLDVEGSWEPRDKAVWPAWSVRWYPDDAERDGKSWHAQVGTAATPALALICALLRAVEAQPLRHNARDGASPQNGEVFQ